MLFYLKMTLIYTGLGLFVLFFFGLCILVHEWGHLRAALWRGLHVERFSIGFGKKLFSFTRGGVEYCVSILPFGGYVALPQLEPVETPTTAAGVALPPAKPWDRILTALAGPLGNIVFGFLLAAVVWYVGVERPAPMSYCDVISVEKSSPEYRAGLRPGDRIIAVNGKQFEHGWQELSQRIMLASDRVTLRVRRGRKVLDIRYKPAPNPKYDGIGYPFFEVRMPTVVAGLVPGYPARAAGVKTGDNLLAVNGKEVASPAEFVRAINATGGKPFDLAVERGGRRLVIHGLRARADQVDGKTVYRIGVRIDTPMVLAHPTPWRQFVRVFDQTSRVLHLLFVRTSLVRPKHLSGPVGIAEAIAAKIFIGGLRAGLSFIVYVSFGLALVNLIPIPVLDGGHIVFGLVELIIRRRPPVRLVYWLQNAFAILLITFMLYVTYYDVRRLPRFLRLFKPAHPTEQAAQPETGRAP